MAVKHRTDPRVAAFVGKQIRGHRRAAKLSQRQLANDSGLTDSSICRYERGDGIPSVTALLELSIALGCEAYDLLPTSEHARQLIEGEVMP